jgi:hypothetical protein
MRTDTLGRKVKDIGSSGIVVRIGGWGVRYKDQAGVFISIIKPCQEPAVEAAAGHQGPSSESRGQPPAEVGDPMAQRVEE